MKTIEHNTEAWRLPEVPETDTLLLSEPGRVLDNKSEGGTFNTCFRAYGFTVAKGPYGTYQVRRQSGLGVQTMRIGKEAVTALGMLDSDARFFMLYTLFEVAREASNAAHDTTERQYRAAFADGRLRKRKQRGQDAVKVWIESA